MTRPNTGTVTSITYRYIVSSMTSIEHKTHSHPDHVHGPGCGHETISHGDHVDYLHDGHRHAPHDDHYDEH